MRFFTVAGGRVGSRTREPDRTLGAVPAHGLNRQSAVTLECPARTRASEASSEWRPYRWITVPEAYDVGQRPGTGHTI